MTQCNGGSLGEARGDRPPPPTLLSLNQTEARKEEYIYFLTPHPPLIVWIRHCIARV